MLVVLSKVDSRYNNKYLYIYLIGNSYYRYYLYTNI